MVTFFWSSRKKRTVSANLVRLIVVLFMVYSPLAFFSRCAPSWKCFMRTEKFFRNFEKFSWILKSFQSEWKHFHEEENPYHLWKVARILTKEKNIRCPWSFNLGGLVNMQVRGLLTLVPHCASRRMISNVWQWLFPLWKHLGGLNFQRTGATVTWLTLWSIFWRGSCHRTRARLYMCAQMRALIWATFTIANSVWLNFRYFFWKKTCLEFSEYKFLILFDKNCEICLCTYETFHILLRTIPKIRNMMKELWTLWDFCGILKTFFENFHENTILSQTFHNSITILSSNFHKKHACNCRKSLRCNACFMWNYVKVPAKLCDLQKIFIKWNIFRNKFHSMKYFHCEKPGGISQK